MADNLVSVIVPVYKVEKELTRCLDSILSQTYKNLEILIVDDGSPDRCPQICDTYAKKDHRIKVFHKENGGLSSARNYAIERASGDYIAFIDSDDWVEDNFIELLLNNLLKEQADLSIVGYIFAWDSGKVQGNTIGNEYEVMNTEQAIRELFIQKKFQCMVCTKLYKKELFNQVRFPEGKLFEDIAIGLDIFKQCHKVVFDGQQKYYYFQRADSIFNSRFDKNKLSMLDFIEGMIAYSKSRGGIYDTEAEAFYLRASLMLILQAYNSMGDAETDESIKILRDQIKKHRKYIVGNPYIEIRRKIVLLAILMRVSPKLLNKLWKVKVNR